jgi:hypothetical protein
MLFFYSLLFRYEFEINTLKTESNYFLFHFTKIFIRLFFDLKKFLFDVFLTLKNFVFQIENKNLCEMLNQFSKCLH